MTRTFIALEMNEQIQSHLAGIIRQVAQALPLLNWVDPAGIHLTLAFLGELNATQLKLAMQATAAAAQQGEPFSYRLTRINIFGSPRQPRVLWMGIEEKTLSLTRLHSALNQELEKRDFTIEKRPFSPHLTLARVKNPLSATELERLQGILTGKQTEFFSSNAYPVQSLNVMKSELQRSGAEYTCLQTYPLN